MNLLQWWRRRQESPSALRLARLLSPEEGEDWHRLEETTPLGRRVLPMVPLALIVEGRLRENLSGEVIPFLEVTGDGFPTKAYFYERGEPFSLLESLGLTCEIIGAAQKGSQGNSPGQVAEKKTTPPPLETKESELTEEGESQNEQAGEEGKKDANTVELTAMDFAQMWWRGEISTVLRVPEMAPQEEKEGESQENKKKEQPEGTEKKEQEEARKAKPREREKEAQEEASPKCPVCGAEMVLKVAKKGKMAGQPFWSCSRYPECKGTRPKR